MQRSKVDLPEPEGPIRQVTLPASMLRLISCSTAVLPKLLLRLCTAMAVACSGDWVRLMPAGAARAACSCSCSADITDSMVAEFIEFIPMQH